MAPYLINHPVLIHNWFQTRERADNVTWPQQVFPANETHELEFSVLPDPYFFGLLYVNLTADDRDRMRRVLDLLKI